MFSSIKYLFSLVLLLIAGYIGWNTYQYFTVASAPSVSLVGLEHEGTYGGEIKASIKGSDAYKVARLVAKIDGKPVIAAKINRRAFEYPWAIDTKALQPGKHTIELEVENGAYNRKRTDTGFVFYVDNQPLQVVFTKNQRDAKVPQGRTLHLQFQANKEIKTATAKTLSKSYPCFRESDRGFVYECFVPVDTEEVAQEYLVVLEVIDKAGNTATREGAFQVTSFPFKKQVVRIDPEKMKAENEAGASEKQFELEIEELTKKSPHEKLWQGSFIAPLEVKDPKQISTEYGVIRATQERGLRQHKAIDVYAMPKSVVWAPQGGVIVLKTRFAHSGNTVVIDHGWGILSLFFHLDTFAPIELGEKVRKGNPIGTLGKTGYATGYHLHWEMRVNNVAIDPMEWTKSGF